MTQFVEAIKLVNQKARWNLDDEEIEMLCHLSRGESWKDIAARRKVSVSTVRNCCRKICEKTSSQNFNQFFARVVVCLFRQKGIA